MNKIQSSRRLIQPEIAYGSPVRKRLALETPPMAKVIPFNRGNSASGLAPYLNKITNADCTTEMRNLPDACIDLIVTDPPYLVHYRDRTGRKIANDDNSSWVLPAFSEAYRVLKPDSFCVSFYGWNKIDVFLSAWRTCGFNPVGHFTWTKSYASTIGFTEMRHECAYLLAKGRPGKPVNPPSDVLPWKYSGNRLHPTQKPVSGLTPLIEAYSRPGDIVLDPFAGSGTTGIAARNCRRQFVLFEMDQNYFDAANERLLTELN